MSKAWDYHRQPHAKDEWLTPPELIKSLGEFDLDPCSPINRPWSTARNHFTEADNGLLKIWTGRVWCNPPYVTASKWMARCSEHGNAIALAFARTETKMFFDTVWNCADAILFLKGRLTFLNVDGSRPKFTGGAPSCLVAYGKPNGEALAAAVKAEKLTGKLIFLK